MSLVLAIALKKEYLPKQLYISVFSHSFHGEIKTQAGPLMKLMRPELEKYCDSDKRDA